MRRRLGQASLLLIWLLLWSSMLSAQSLELVRLDGDQLRATPRGMRFLTDETVRRLKNGASLDYVFRVSILSGPRGSSLAQATYRFVFSYDIWEEKYAVTRLEPSQRAVSNLSAAAAEAWCLESLTIPTGKLAPDRQIWVSVEYRLEEPVEQPSDSSNFTLSSLIDIFSRRDQRNPESGLRESGPVRLADLPRR